MTAKDNPFLEFALLLDCAQEIVVRLPDQSAQFDFLLDLTGRLTSALLGKLLPVQGIGVSCRGLAEQVVDVFTLTERIGFGACVSSSPVIQLMPHLRIRVGKGGFAGERIVVFASGPFRVPLERFPFFLDEGQAIFLGQQSGVDRSGFRAVGERDARRGAYGRLAPGTEEELAHVAQRRAESGQERLFDHRQAQLGLDRLALRIGRRDDDLDRIARLDRLGVAVGGPNLELNAQVALDVERTGRRVEPADDLRIADRFGPIGHHGHGQIEIRRQLGVDRDRQLVDALVQLDEPIVEDLGPLEGDQRQRRLLAPMDLHHRLVAHFERMPIGQDAQPGDVVLVGDVHGRGAADRVLEPVGPLGAQHVIAAGVELERFQHLARFGVRFQFVLFDEHLAHHAVDLGPLEHAQFERFGDRLAFGVDRLERQLERLTGEKHGPDRRGGDREPLRGQDERLARSDVPLG